MKRVLICPKIVVPILFVVAALLRSMGVFAGTLPIDQVEVSPARLQRRITTKGKLIDVVDHVIREGLKVQARTS